MGWNEDEDRDSLESISLYLKEEFEMDSQDIEEMLDEYFKNLETLLATATDNIEAKDFPSLRKTSHTIKGVASNIGSMSISGMGKLMEIEAACADAGSCLKIVESIRAQYKEMKAARENEKK